MLPPSRSLHHPLLSELSRIPEAYFSPSLSITALLTVIFCPSEFIYFCFLVCLSPPPHTLEFELPESRDFTGPTQTGTESGPWHMAQTQIFAGWTSGQPRIWHQHSQIEALPLNVGNHLRSLSSASWWGPIWSETRPLCAGSWFIICGRSVSSFYSFTFHWANSVCFHSRNRSKNHSLETWRMNELPETGNDLL